MIAFLDGWIVLARCLARVAIWSGGTMIFAAALLIGMEVLLRKLFAVSLGGADELAGYAFAVATSWALALTLLERANVRVDAVYGHLGARVRAMCDVLSLVSLAIFVGFLGWHAIQVLASSLQYSSRATTPLATPLWIPQALWVVGFALFLFALAPLLLRTIAAVIAGDLVSARRLAGARTTEEEAAAEVVR
jgi:TRAP-type mannitol/chloroaromatic compound transport system permease small subunit